MGKLNNVAMVGRHGEMANWGKQRNGEIEKMGKIRESGGNLKMGKIREMGKQGKQRNGEIGTLGGEWRQQGKQGRWRKLEIMTKMGKWGNQRKYGHGEMEKIENVGNQTTWEISKWKNREYGENR